MKMEFESIDEVMKKLDAQIKAEEKECLAIIDRAFGNIQKDNHWKEVGNDVDSIEI